MSMNLLCTEYKDNFDRHIRCKRKIDGGHDVGSLMWRSVAVRPSATENFLNNTETTCRKNNDFAQRDRPCASQEVAQPRAEWVSWLAVDVSVLGQHVT